VSDLQIYFQRKKEIYPTEKEVKKEECQTLPNQIECMLNHHRLKIAAREIRPTGIATLIHEEIRNFGNP
jgi:hypothetical protein